MKIRTIILLILLAYLVRVIMVATEPEAYDVEGYESSVVACLEESYIQYARLQTFSVCIRQDGTFITSASSRIEEDFYEDKLKEMQDSLSKIVD